MSTLVEKWIIFKKEKNNLFSSTAESWPFIPDPHPLSLALCPHSTYSLSTNHCALWHRWDFVVSSIWNSSTPVLLAVHTQPRCRFFVVACHDMSGKINYSRIWIPIALCLSLRVSLTTRCESKHSHVCLTGWTMCSLEGKNPSYSHLRLYGLKQSWGSIGVVRKWR